MRLEGSTVVLEKKECQRCNEGIERVAIEEDCPNCLGTGRANKGKGKGRCNAKTNDYGDPSRRYKTTCYFGKITTGYDEVTCRDCEGNYRNFTDEGYTDNTPVEILDTIPWRVERMDRAHLLAESLFGLGLGSCTDYGDHKNQTDDDLLEKAKHGFGRHVQLCKIVRNKNDLRIADAIVVVTSDQGYSILPEFKES